MFGRVFVFARIDEQKENLITMLSGVKDQIALSDEQLLEIDRRLFARSMEEFEEKFPKQPDLDSGAETSEMAEFENDFVKSMKTRAGGQFEVWHRKAESAERTKKALTEEERKRTELYMGVQTFFEHSRGEGRGLLLLNMSLSEILEAGKKEKLELYLNTVNEKEDGSKAVWLAILPEVEMQGETALKRERFRGTGKAETKIRQDELMQIAALLAEHRVMLCYQYETGEKTSPEAFAKTGQKYYRQESAAFEGNKYSDYMCCCYPNLSSEREKLSIGAAFVAAGMLVCGNREGEQTALPKELYPYTKLTREELKGIKYGCCLSSETGEKGWAAVPRMLLFSARTLAWQQGAYRKAEEVLQGWKEREAHVFT